MQPKRKEKFFNPKKESHRQTITIHPDEHKQWGGFIELWVREDERYRYNTLLLRTIGIPDDAEDPMGWLQESTHNCKAPKDVIEQRFFWPTIGKTQDEVLDKLEEHAKIMREDGYDSAEPKDGYDWDDDEDDFSRCYSAPNVFTLEDAKLIQCADEIQHAINEWRVLIDGATPNVDPEKGRGTIDAEEKMAIDRRLKLQILTAISGLSEPQWELVKKELYKRDGRIKYENNLDLYKV